MRRTRAGGGALAGILLAWACSSGPASPPPPAPAPTAPPAAPRPSPPAAAPSDADALGGVYRGEEAARISILVGAEATVLYYEDTFGPEAAQCSCAALLAPDGPGRYRLRPFDDGGFRGVMRVSTRSIEFDEIEAGDCCGRPWPGMSAFPRGGRAPLGRCAVRPGGTDSLARADGGSVEVVEDPLGDALVRYAVDGRMIVEHAAGGRLDCRAR